MHQFSFPISEFQASKPLELVHSDVWGPAPVTSSNDFQYYLFFVDEYSKFTWLYLLKHKFDALDIFKFFKATVENQLNSKIKILRTNNGGEFTSNAFKYFCSTHDIVHQFSCPHTPQQNGLVERKHRYIVECALTLLSHSQLPPSYWSYAVSTVVHIINRLPTPNLKNSTPWEVLFNSKHDLTHLRTFGCICFPLLRPYNAHKLLPRTTSCIFLGYPAHTKGYICQDPLTSQVYISRHVRFNESEFLYPQPLSTVPFVDPSLNPTQPPHISIPLVTTQCPLFTSQSDVPLHASSLPLPDQSSSCQLTPHPKPTPLSAQSP